MKTEVKYSTVKTGSPDFQFYIHSRLQFIYSLRQQFETPHSIIFNKQKSLTK